MQSVRIVDGPTTVPAVGEPPKQIEEYIGRVNTGTAGVSVAIMTSPAGWSEPSQVPEFDEYTIVLEGAVTVDHAGGTEVAAAGQAIVAPAGRRVRYSTQVDTKYVAVCVPAFSPETVHRD